MPWLVETALSNAAVATVLAAAAIVVSRCLHRPALTHALWVLVLVKLVTPPIAGIEIPVSTDVISAGDPDPPAVFTKRPPQAESLAVLSHGAVAAADRASDRGEVDSVTGKTRNTETHAAMSMQIASDTSARAARVPPMAGKPVWWQMVRWPLLFSSLLIVWACGSAMITIVLFGRWLRFVRLVRAVDASDVAAQRRADELAARLGLCRSPPVLLFPWVCSPMLWGCGRSVRLLFPASLWRQLDGSARDALLLHELAHYRRGDQWVRLLELVASVVYWWHPVVWWARRALAAAEEECCDAWVVSRMVDSPRTYADALLVTLEFLAERRPALPPAASGLGELPALKKRLVQIMRRSVRQSLSRAARWCLVLLAVTVLPLGPVLTSAPSRAAVAAPVSTGRMTRPGGDDRRLISIPVPGEVSTERQRDGEIAGSGPEIEVNSLRPSVSGSLRPTASDWWNARPSSHWATATSPGGRHRLVVEVGRRVRLESLEHGRALDLSRARLTSAAFLPGGQRFAAGSLDGSVRVWDAESGEPASLMGWHDAEVRAVAVSPDGRRVASGSADGAVIVWEAASGGILHTWTAIEGPIASLSFSPDGARLAVAAGGWHEPASGRIAVLETIDWSGQQNMTARSAVAVLQFTADGALLSADWSGRVLRWDLGTAEPQTWGRVEKETVSAASFSPDHRLLDRPPI